MSRHLRGRGQVQLFVADGLRHGIRGNALGFKVFDQEGETGVG